MDTENKHREDFLKKRTQHKNPFKTPENYFDNLSETIITSKKEFNIPQKTGFVTPNNYFDTFKIPLKKQNSKIRSLLPYLTTIAAIFIIGFFVFKPKNINPINHLNTNDIINYLVLDESLDINEIINDTTISSFNMHETSPNLDQLSIELDEYDLIDF